MAGNSSETKGSKYIANTFQRWGVTHIFFQEAILREVLIEAEAVGIKRVLARSEKSAAYMADAYARVTGQPGICMSQSVGAANLAAGLQDPFLASSPVIGFTGKQAHRNQYRNAYQEIPHKPLFEPVTKAQFSLDIPDQLPLILRRALKEAMCGRPGPVHIDLPDYAGRHIEDGLVSGVIPGSNVSSKLPPFRPTPEAEYLRQAQSALADADRPVIIVGGGARIADAGIEIIELVECTNIPIGYTLSGKGVVPDSHPLCFGLVGTYARPCGNRIAQEADLVIFLGSRTSDQATLRWAIPSEEARVIQVDIEPTELGRNYDDAITLLGDVKTVARALKDEILEQPDRIGWTKRIKSLISQWMTETEDVRLSSAVPCRPERLCHEIEVTLPHDAILVVDTGYAAVWTGNYIQFRERSQDYLRAAGSLGWALPAAIGAKCGAPDRPVICFTGDGGAGYHLSDLETAKRCGINIIVVINNNNALAQDAHGIVGAPHIYGDRPGNPEDLYRFSEINFADAAKAFGCSGIRITRPEEIAPAIKNALAANEPVVIEVLTDENAAAPVDYTTSGI